MTITGTVTTIKGKAIRRANVVFENRDKGDVTDEDGIFRLELKNNDKYIEVSATGYHTKTAYIEEIMLIELRKDKSCSQVKKWKRSHKKYKNIKRQSKKW